MRLESTYEHRTYDYDSVQEAEQHERDMLDDGWELAFKWTKTEIEYRKSKQDF